MGARRGHHHKTNFEKRILSYEQIRDMLTSKREPYALWDDMKGHLRYVPPEYKPDPYYKHRRWWRELGTRPWEYEDSLHSRSGRGPGLNPWILSTSANAPFATDHNEPLQEKTRPIVIPPWEKDEHQHMKSAGYCGGNLHPQSALLKKVHQLPWELDFDASLHPEDVRVSKTNYPHNIRNEKPWNRRRASDLPEPPQPLIIREPSPHVAPFATKYNQVVKYGAGKPSQCNNLDRLYQRCPKPFVETLWPFERHEYDSHGKLPREPYCFPRDPNTFEPWPYPRAKENIIKGQKHCHLKEGHKIKHLFYPGDPTKTLAAGDFGRVQYPLKLISYPRDPATYVPFPVYYAYEPEIKNQKHCDQSEGHISKHQFYPGDPSRMPAAGSRVAPKVFPPTWDVRAPYKYD